jgi:hypothetical protein
LVNAPEPTRAEVLGWLTRTGRTAAEAVDHFWPGSIGADRTRVHARIRKWAQLARDAGDPAAPAAQPGPSRPQGDQDPPPGRPSAARPPRATTSRR